MPGVTREQIEQAKEWDLLTYLQAYEPQELKRCGNEFCTVSHDSLKISNGKWHWHSQGIGGRTALDYLIKVRGMGFVAAVEILCGMGSVEMARADGGAAYKRMSHGIAAYGDTAPGAVASGTAASGLAVPAGLPRELSLPKPNRYGTAMVSYLQGRGIDADIISKCIGLGILYESREYRNCVFVGRDPERKPRYACVRGTRGRYKGEAEGSDKRYGFCLPSRDSSCPSVTVAESPIDALSIASLRKMQVEDWAADNYLSLGGTAPCALLQFLADHPAVDKVALCLDNDKAGILGMERIHKVIQESPELSGRVLDVKGAPPPASCGKDYNRLLQRKQAEKLGRDGGAWQL